jgi:uncharacterized membrane protein
VGVRGKELIAGAHVTEQLFKRTAAAFAAVAAAALAQTAIPAAAQQPADAGGDQALIDQGKNTYAQKCSHCHGPNMVNSGTITPDLRQFPDDKARFVTTRSGPLLRAGGSHEGTARGMRLGGSACGCRGVSGPRGR